MSDDIYPGGPVMIKIDGTKIRKIREQKGLTQLYIATAVDVTTDTVSRWENKRYPSIKKENGLKLAQALEVTLEEILDTESEPEPGKSPAQQTVEDNSADAQPSSSGDRAYHPASRSFSFKTGLLITMMFIPLFGVIIYFTHFQQDTTVPHITVKRTVSPHFIAGQPLPVFIHISSSTEKPISFILRENLPPGTTVLSAYPEVSEKQKKNNSIQWLDNISSSSVFIYTISTAKDFTGTILFDGQLKVSSSNKFEVAVSGDQNSVSGFYHWADRDKDNRISDEEILTIYDLTNSNQYAEIDMDLLEEIWLGDGYIWQPNEQRFSILE
jgi:transcriptional regulator with XRE-family HTH domain